MFVILIALALKNARNASFKAHSFSIANFGIKINPVFAYA